MWTVRFSELREKSTTMLAHTRYCRLELFKKPAWHPVIRLALIASAILSSMSILFFFSSRRRHTRLTYDWSSDVCSSDLAVAATVDLDLDDGIHVGTQGLKRLG